MSYPNPKATALKKLQGNPGGRHLNNLEPKPAAKRPPPPRWLSKPARKQWQQIAKELHECGLLTSIDGLALAMLCENYAIWYQAKVMVDTQGIFCESDKGNLYQHPAVGAMNTAQKNVITLMREFGMTPSSRSTIKLQPSDDGQHSIVDMLSLMVGVK